MFKGVKGSNRFERGVVAESVPILFKDKTELPTNNYEQFKHLELIEKHPILIALAKVRKTQNSELSE